VIVRKLNPNAKVMHTTEFYTNDNFWNSPIPEEPIMSGKSKMVGQPQLQSDLDKIETESHFNGFTPMMLPVTKKRFLAHDQEE